MPDIHHLMTGPVKYHGTFIGYTRANPQPFHNDGIMSITKQDVVQTTAAVVWTGHKAARLILPPSGGASRGNKKAGAGTAGTTIKSDNLVFKHDSELCVCGSPLLLANFCEGSNKLHLLCQFCLPHCELLKHCLVPSLLKPLIMCLLAAILVHVHSLQGMRGALALIKYFKIVFLARSTSSLLELQQTLRSARQLTD